MQLDQIPPHHLFSPLATRGYFSFLTSDFKIDLIALPLIHTEFIGLRRANHTRPLTLISHTTSTVLHVRSSVGRGGSEQLCRKARAYLFLGSVHVISIQGPPSFPTVLEPLGYHIHVGKRALYQVGCYTGENNKSEQQQGGQPERGEINQVNF